MAILYISVAFDCACNYVCTDCTHKACISGFLCIILSWIQNVLYYKGSWQFIGFWAPWIIVKCKYKLALSLKKDANHLCGVLVELVWTNVYGTSSKYAYIKQDYYMDYFCLLLLCYELFMYRLPYNSSRKMKIIGVIFFIVIIEIWAYKTEYKRSYIVISFQTLKWNFGITLVPLPVWLSVCVCLRSWSVLKERQTEYFGIQHGNRVGPGGYAKHIEI